MTASMTSLHLFKMARPLRSFSYSTARPTSKIERVGVVGAGQMGLGIALVTAQKARLPVTNRYIAKISGQGHRVRRTSIEDLASSDFVIEAVPEIPRLKFAIFGDLARICPKHAILATDTSSISVTRIAAATASDPTDTSTSSRVVSTHFMNPVPVQKGVEIIGGLQTSEQTLASAVAFCQSLGKVTSVSVDSPGFLANRILMPYINEAIICVETGVGDRDSVDAIMKNGTNVPMGPLQLADFIGLDTCLAIMRVLHEETGDTKYRSSILLRKMVDAGWLGKKSSKGFYNY